MYTLREQLTQHNAILFSNVNTTVYTAILVVTMGREIRRSVSITACRAAAGILI
jgi:hypothetical protein